MPSHNLVSRLLQSLTFQIWLILAAVTVVLFHAFDFAFPVVEPEALVNVIFAASGAVLAESGLRHIRVHLVARSLLSFCEVALERSSAPERGRIP